MNARMSDQAGGEVHEPVEQAGDEEVRELDTLAETRSAPAVDDNQQHSPGAHRRLLGDGKRHLRRCPV